MPKFTPGDRVIFEHQGTRRTGRVTALLNKQRRVVGDSGERAVVALRNLRQAPDRVLLLESRLDLSLRKSGRVYGPMMQRLIGAYGAEVLYERVHTTEDFKLFVQKEGRKPGTRFIHYIGHGEKGNDNRFALNLTFDKLDLEDDLDVFNGLAGKVIIFSCCQVGANQKTMSTIKEASGAAAVIAYRTEVTDTYTNLAEALLYDRMLNGVSPKNAVHTVAEGLSFMGIRTEGTRGPVLVCV